MLVLIKREISDMLVQYLVPSFVVAALIAFLAAFAHNSLVRELVGVPEFIYSTTWFVGISLAFFPGFIGLHQMHEDRNKKISAFLCTLATDRKGLFIAKLIAGGGFFILLYLFLALAECILLWLYPRAIPTDMTVFRNTFIVMILLGLSNYAIGLQMGLLANKGTGGICGALLGIVLVGLVVIKGLGVVTWLLLALVIAAFLSSTWLKFRHSPL